MIESLLTKNLLPDPLIRFGIRKLLKERLKEEKKQSAEAQQDHLMKLISMLKESPIAVNTANANEQHYEVPTSFYRKVLGKNLKYSCGFWEEGDNNLDESERKMLELTCRRAGIKDGDEILELGCGWGSLTLFMAEKFHGCRITAVSNSRTQKEYIDSESSRRGLKNVTVITADMNTFVIDKKYDRIVSVEMFEHMRNYAALFNNIHGLLKPGGELFIHIFTHREYSYLFEVKNETDWMAKYFFTGGIMPGNNLLFYFSGNFEVKNHWIINGRHYEKTSNAWLKNMDRNKDSILKLFSETYGGKNKIKWWVYWRVFFMSCAELWGYKNGEEWMVSHYLFKRI
ncbi:MAG TPA: cyclopropane-fatty-acyl-phospholipid synthase family protein [Ignavibacteriaceae bacterium]|nr:cyclopropane-fatty-acyl-phospholipid synthase family protein [Ignavibacteriaceae bacterium]